MEFKRVPEYDLHASSNVAVMGYRLAGSEKRDLSDGTIFVWIAFGVDPFFMGLFQHSTIPMKPIKSFTN